MSRRLVAVVAVTLIAVSGMGAAAVIMVPPIPEQLVEGHTVWAVIETVSAPTKVEEYAAAVAVLVRERVTTKSIERFPGVLWFNDQFLVNPVESRQQVVANRFPCTGVVIAVNRGDLIVDQDLGGNWTLVDPEYVESYLITDPNDRTWIVDLWNTTYDRPAWTSALMNNQAGGGIPDNGRCRGSAQTDGKFCIPVTRQANLEPNTACPARSLEVTNTQAVGNMAFPSHKDPGDHGHGFPCDGCSMVQYNAVLYMFLDDLDVPAAPKNHTEGTGDDWLNDVAACQPSSTNSWPCPDGDDDREGNSHPYNPGYVFNPYDGKDNHGGSDVCDGQALECHATRNIDVYYGYVAPPVDRRFVVYDLAGSEAPYHCHDEFTACSDTPGP